MAWRTLLISSPGHASMRSGQFVLKREEGTVTVPLEDIAMVIVETRELTLSSSLISSLHQAGGGLCFCDAQHMPVSLSLPFHPHSRQSKVTQLQANWSTPFKKRSWQRLIQRKIHNQAHNLKGVNPDLAAHLLRLSKEVDSGDSKNREAQAARQYWSTFMGKSFARFQEDLANGALNYAYAVVRAAIARALAGAGLVPSLGLHHCAELNAFNLADDMIEPFRPLVDAHVLRLVSGREEGQLTKEDRGYLVDVLNTDVLIKGEVQTLLNATEKSVESLVRASEAKDHRLLISPEAAL